MPLPLAKAPVSGSPGTGRGDSAPPLRATAVALVRRRVDWIVQRASEENVSILIATRDPRVGELAASLDGGHDGVGDNLVKRVDMAGVARAVRIRGHHDRQAKVGDDVDHLATVTPGEANRMAVHLC